MRHTEEIRKGGVLMLPGDKRVVVTGMGWTTPVGHDIETGWKAMLNGKSGVAPITIFDAGTFPTQFAAEIKNFKLEEHIPNPEPHLKASRSTKFALSAAWQAWKNSRLNEGDHIPAERVGIYMGAGEGGVDFDNFMELIIKAWKDGEFDMKAWTPLAFEHFSTIRELEQEPHMVCNHIAMLLGLKGPAFNCLTACAASTQAIGQATEIIRRGEAEAMIAGGAHSMIHPLGVTGFNRLTALSTRNEEPQKASRPFHVHRDGFVLGEGSSVLMIENLESALNRGAEIHGEIIGYGSSADAFRVTDQHPEGRGGIACMRSALKDAEIKPEMIDYISTHGTGTQENDLTETIAMKAVFGEHAYKIPISSVKSMVGHLIAAAGATELITCLLSIRDGMVPPTINLDEPDPACDLDYVPNEARKCEVNVALSNSFGFGGQNDTLIVKRFEQ
jgi:3-oxoacyl-[acyl-carrier-protein] synthase II